MFSGRWKWLARKEQGLALRVQRKIIENDAERFSNDSDNLCFTASCLCICISGIYNAYFVYLEINNIFAKR
jgi:hypothetical protein